MEEMQFVVLHTEGEQHQEHDHDAADDEVIGDERCFVLHTTRGLNCRVRVLTSRERWEQQLSDFIDKHPDGREWRATMDFVTPYPKDDFIWNVY